MKDLLVTIARGLVDDKDAVTVTVDEPNAEGVIVYHLHRAERSARGHGQSDRQTGQNCEGNSCCDACRCKPHE